MMVRPITLVCAFAAGLSGLFLYSQKHKTTQLDQRIAKIVYDTQRIKSRTTMLRTEWTLLNQPDRLRDLATHFIPALQPLQPAQFVQMSAIASVLPPIQKNGQLDKTREELTKAVATSRGQPLPSNNEKQKTDSSAPSADFGPTPPLDNTASVNSGDEMVEKDSSQKNALALMDTNGDSSDNHTAHKSALNAEELDTSSANETKNKSFADLTLKAEKTKAHLKRKKTLSNITGNFSTENNTQPGKEYLVKKVSFNINPDNPTSLKSSNSRLPKTETVKTQPDLNLSHIPTHKTNKHENKNFISSLHPVTHNSMKLPRNESTKSYFSESALSNHQEAALPAPVPFAR